MRAGCAALQGGATAVAVWVVGNTAFVANVGDAKCVLARETKVKGSGANFVEKDLRESPSILT